MKECIVDSESSRGADDHPRQLHRKAETVRTDMAFKLEEWHQLSAELLELERLEHPPLHDRLGRRWEWTTGDLYTHCGITVNAAIVPTLERHLTDSARENANYRDSCDLCWGPRGNPFAEEDQP